VIRAKRTGVRTTRKGPPVFDFEPVGPESGALPRPPERLDVAARALERLALEALDPSAGGLTPAKRFEVTDAAKILARSLSFLLGRVVLDTEDADAVRLARAALAFLGDSPARLDRDTVAARSKGTRDRLVRARIAFDGPDNTRRRAAMVNAFDAALRASDPAGDLALRLAFIDPAFTTVTGEQVASALKRGGPLEESGRLTRRNVARARVLGELSELAGVDTVAAFKKWDTRRLRTRPNK
jgi:hypothetical protein